MVAVQEHLKEERQPKKYDDQITIPSGKYDCQDELLTRESGGRCENQSEKKLMSEIWRKIQKKYSIRR